MPLSEPHATSSNKTSAPFRVVIIFLLLAITGAAFFPLIPIRLMPVEEVGTISVSYPWQEKSAQQVEEQITSQLESSLASLKNVKNIRSTSATGMGSIFLEFDKGTDLEHARYEVAMLMRSLYPSLPEGAGYPTIGNNSAVNTRSKALLSCTISADADPWVISRYAEEKIRPQLATIPGLSQINIQKGAPYGWVLRFNQQRLQQLGFTSADISSAISRYLKITALGHAAWQPHNDLDTQYAHIKISGAEKDTVDWGHIPLSKTNGRISYLKDLMVASYEQLPARSYFRNNGRNTITIDISANEAANFVKLAEKVRFEIAALKATLPLGYTMAITADASEAIKEEVDKIGYRALATIAILLSFVLAITREWQYLLLITISLFANLIIAVICYYFMHIQLHLYSFAGISLSMGMLIDGSIVVIDHLRHKKNKKVFLALVGAHLTTIGSVCVIFFLDKSQQASLGEFAWVIIINLLISIPVAFFLVPALMELLPSPRKIKVRKHHFHRRRTMIWWRSKYQSGIFFLLRYRKAVLITLIFIFGVPLFLLPRASKGNTVWDKCYNATIGSSLYSNTIRPVTDKWLGGTLFLFLNREDGFFMDKTNKDRTKINMQLSMPKGVPLEVMNKLTLQLENYLQQFEEIALYQSNVNSGETATIDIFFHKKYDNSGFPRQLKEKLITITANTGLADFQITGEGTGFNNRLAEENTNCSLTLNGYSYEQLLRIAAKVKDKLVLTPRIGKIYIVGDRQQSNDESTAFEYVFKLKEEAPPAYDKLAAAHLSNSLPGEEIPVMPVWFNNTLTTVVMMSDKPEKPDLWELSNTPMATDSGSFTKLNAFTDISRESTGGNIVRNNQQYQLFVNYTFVGELKAGKNLQRKLVEEISTTLPLGYTIRNENADFWEESSSKLIWLVLLGIGIIFIICCILLDSMAASLPVLLMIPVSFIGVFITGYLFRFPFDQGGYAAFIVLSGLVVNWALYILNDYQLIRQQRPRLTPIQQFFKAYDSKIVPILLSAISSALGMVPFILFDKGEAFWYSLALCSIGGLIVSVFGTLFIMPVLIKKLVIHHQKY